MPSSSSLCAWLQALLLALVLSDVGQRGGTLCLALQLSQPPMNPLDQPPHPYKDFGRPVSAVSACGQALCQCSEDGREARCLHLKGNLTSLPSLPQTVQTLKLGFDGSFRNLTNDIFFYKVSSITTLHLLKGKLTSLNNRSFVGITNLTSLHVENVFDRFLYETDEAAVLMAQLLDISSLRFLKARGFFYFNVFFAAKSSHIEILDLSNNPFYNEKTYYITESMQIGEFGAFEMLKELYLNSISSIFEYELHIRIDRVLKIRKLYLENNMFKNFPQTCRGNESLFPELEVLSLKDNDLSAYPHRLCLPRLKVLWMGLNPGSKIPGDFFSNDHFPMLTALYLDEISFETPSLTGLTHRLMTNCCENLETLSLQENNIDFSSVDNGVLSGMPRLQTVFLDGNDFRKVNDTLFHRLFWGLSSLRNLSLSNCQFQLFTRLTFKIFPNLINLNLSNNRIKEIGVRVFEPLPKLRVLDLSMNDLSTIDEEVFSLENQKTLQRVFLNDNPFQCTCDLLWLSLWMVENPAMFDDTFQYDCRNLPGIDVLEYAFEAGTTCILSHTASALIIFSCSLAIACLTIFSLVFRFRWHLRLMLHELFRGPDIVRRQYLLHNCFDYDVFVCYDSEDLPWVRQHLMPQLEMELGLRLCVHQRDFIPGRTIVDNISRRVMSSKKILVLYSKDFVHSPWCQFELTFCLRHVMDCNDALIVVCLDDVLSRQMTSAMIAVLKTTTYIEWKEGEGEAATRCFWRRLREALEEVIPPLGHV